MIFAAAMSETSLPKSLGLSVLGMIIVFIVLIFLMVIIYIMSLILKKSTAKPVSAAGSADSAAAPAPSDDSDATTLILPSNQPPADPAEPSQTEAATQAVSADIILSEQFETAAPVTRPPHPQPKPRKFRVVVNGDEYEVDAETPEFVPESGGSLPQQPAATAQAEIETQVTGSPQLTMFSGVRKYKVTVNGEEYEVNAKTGETLPGSESERGQ